MSSIAITQTIARAIRRLHAGEKINRLRRRRTTWYYWVNEHECNLMTEDLFHRLLQAKFIEETDVRGSGMFVRGANKAWKASQKCLDLKLPPQELWVEE